MSTGRYTAGEKRRRCPAASLAVMLLLLGLAANSVNAQDWTSGLSPWPGLGTLNPQSTLSPWPGIGSLPQPSSLSPWSGLANPMTQSTLPYSLGSPFANPWSGLATPYAAYPQQLFGTWQTPTYPGRPLACPQVTAADSYQPDLTGFWRGSGGETVEIERNRARIWGGQDKPCNCVFFLIGQRLIAYSPDTDTVRKYWYRGAGDQFVLIDESGNLLTFQRAR